MRKFPHKNLVEDRKTKPGRAFEEKIEVSDALTETGVCLNGFVSGFDFEPFPFVFWRAFAFIGDDAGGGRSQAGIAGGAAGFLADVDFSFAALFHW